MTKLDLKKQLKHLYMPSDNTPVIVDVPELKFAMVDGVIQPDESVGQSASYHNAMMALYGISYTLKFMSKLREVDPIDYTVMALEGLWWVESNQFSFERKEPWHFTALMMQPDHITKEMFATAQVQASAKQPDNPALGELRFEAFHEGLSVQIMHIGPYSEEPPTIERLHAFAEEQGYRLRGKHHEIYIGDPRRSAPEKLKTVLRHPIEKV